MVYSYQGKASATRCFEAELASEPLGHGTDVSVNHARIDSESSLKLTEPVGMLLHRFANCAFRRFGQGLNCFLESDRFTLLGKNRNVNDLP